MEIQKDTNSFLPSKGSQRGLWQVADTIEYELLKENAKTNRNNMTEAESAFWQLAKASGLGEKCRRQYIIGEYIVDFFFRKSMLIVELDGGYHRPDPQQGPSKSPLKGDLDTPFRGAGGSLTGDMLADMANSRPLRESWRGAEQVEYDRIRQDWLEHQGYKILRFTNEQILFDTDKVISTIREILSL